MSLQCKGFLVPTKRVFSAGLLDVGTGIIHFMRKDFDKLPKEIQEHGMDFHWDNKKLWSLDIPIEDIDVSELEWHLDTPFWSSEGGHYNLLPRLVLEDIELYPEHKDRVLNADIRYPIDIMENPKGELVILDGMHRLLRLMNEGHKKVKVRKISRDHIDKIKKD